MFNADRRNSNLDRIGESIRSSVSQRLHEAFRRIEVSNGSLDKWTERRIHDENMAKLDLILEADDPAERCYQDLIRELDIEAENGIYLVGTEFQSDALRALAEDPGISGELHLEVPSVARSLFADELGHSAGDADLVWVTIQARYDRAHLDATVSELIMQFLLDDGAAADDMADALRALLYSYHENTVRHVCDLPSLLDDRESRDLIIIVVELEKRSGSYHERIREICRRAGTC